MYRLCCLRSLFFPTPKRSPKPRLLPLKTMRSKIMESRCGLLTNAPLLTAKLLV